MIQIEIPENIITFIEWILPITAFLIGAFKACELLQKEESFVQFIMGDLEDE